MIEEVKMWTACCDICNETYELYDGCIALNEKSAIEEDVKESGEWVLLHNGKTYCSDCHQTGWDDTGETLFAFTKDTPQSGAIELGQVI